MPSYEHRENSGALFRNKRKEQETHPDYKGEMNVDGKMFWLNAWLNTSKTGEKYFSMRLTPKEEQREKPSLRVVGSNDPDPNDEIPF